MIHPAPTVEIDESEPGSRPAVSGVPDGVAVESLWRRIEAYTAHRWGSRDVTFYVQGPGLWHPPLAPFTRSGVTRWDFDAESFVAVTPQVRPRGGLLLEYDREYQIDGTVGATTVPADVAEAFRRLAEYVAASPDPLQLTATSGSLDLGDAIRMQAERPAAWLARAIHYSGAADLLRPYRRA